MARPEFVLNIIVKVLPHVAVTTVSTPLCAVNSVRWPPYSPFARYANCREMREWERQRWIGNIAKGPGFLMISHLYRRKNRFCKEPECRMCCLNDLWRCTKDNEFIKFIYNIKRVTRTNAERKIIKHKEQRQVRSRWEGPITKSEWKTSWTFFTNIAFIASFYKFMPAAETRIGIQLFLCFVDFFVNDSWMWNYTAILESFIKKKLQWKKITSLWSLTFCAVRSALWSYMYI